MLAVVWVSSWQMECCGEPFAVGDRVEWELDEQPDVDWMEAALGAGLAARVTHAEDHHPQADDGFPPRAGRVMGIKRAWGAYAPRVPGDRTRYPVPGSEELLNVTRSDGSEQHAFSALTFNGWVVELELDE
jgi:hypothetical protein